MKPEDNSKLVVVATYGSDAEANIAMGMLRANGIECMLNGEMANDVLGMMLSPVDGEISLLVYERDLPEAKKLLEGTTE